MKLSNVAIHEISSLLSGIKITRIEDKDVMLPLLHNYLVFRKESNAAMEDIQAIANKFREDWAEEIAAVNSLRKSGEPVDEKKYSDYLKAEKDANEAIDKINKGEKEIDIEPIDMDAFVSSVGEEIILSAIGYLVDNGFLK